MIFKYKVKNTEVIVAGRPKKLSDGGEQLSNDQEADAYLSVTDTFMVAPQGKIFVWFPWNEDRSPIPEMYYAVNKVLSWWIFKQEIKKVMVFCDAGTHRSVTVFGAFLTTYFDTFERKEIVASRECLSRYEYTDEQLKRYADPLQYIGTYLEDFPQDVLLFKAMAGDHLGRLDGFSREIYNLVKERYGAKK
jgi:hypothetical protein